MRHVERKNETITRLDNKFHHEIAIRDARSHLPLIRTLAARDYPNLPLNRLIICTDYTCWPQRYSVRPLDKSPETCGHARHSATAEARLEGIIQKAKDEPELVTLLESVIARGFGRRSVMTSMLNVWELEKKYPGERLPDFVRPLPMMLSLVRVSDSYFPQACSSSELAKLLGFEYPFIFS